MTNLTKTTTEATANLWSMALIAAESQAVMAMRLMGMVGAYPVGPTEKQRMVDEKLTAMTEAQVAMWHTLMSFAPPHAVMAAGLKPIRQKTRANARRLSKRALMTKR